MSSAVASLLLLALISTSYAANILIMPSSVFPVHRYTMSHLADELIKRKHSVTWFEYGLEKPQIELPKGVEEIHLKVDVADRTVHDLYRHRNHSVYARQWTDEKFWDNAHQTTAWLAGIQLCDALLTDVETRRKFDELVSRSFEAVVVDDLYNPCGLLHAGLQKSIFIYWSLTGLRTESAWANQSPSPPSYVPVPGTGLTDELNFLERSYNIAAYMRQLYVHQHIVLRRIDALAQKHFPTSNISEAFYIERNASINFVNHPPIFDFARAFMPRVTFVGGLHCRKPKALPTDLAKFVGASKEENGFILITSGFTNHWKHAPQVAINHLLEAIQEKPDIQFVWQYDGRPLKNTPKNLYTAKWLPQQDLLGHSKCRAHITHGGLNSVIESVWHGVPVIGWPLTALNYDNLLRVTARFAGIMLDKKVPAKLDILSAINRIYIKHYKEEVLLFQDMLIDVPYTELNHSAFWVEFIVRHQEVPHARSGADTLNIFQYFLIDVIAFVVGVVAISVFAFVYALKLLMRLIRRGVSCAWSKAKTSSSSTVKSEKEKLKKKKNN